MTRLMRLALWLSGVLLLLLLLGGLMVYTAPVGSGEYRTSPNDLYCARATTYFQRRLFESPRQYYVYEITMGPCERRRVRTLWHAEYEPLSDQGLIDYGMRDVRFVTWSAASEQVTFLLDNDRSLTIPVP